MATRGCLNSPDNFCYICGDFVIKKQHRVCKKVYYTYFGVKLGDQGKSWVPHKVCSVCAEELRQWSKGKKKSFHFGVPMIRREPRNHSDDCYFCSYNVQGYNSKTRKENFYPNLPSAIHPVPHGPGIPVPPEILEDTHVDSDKEDTDSDQDFQCDPCSTEPKLFSQRELNDVVRDLGLPKDSVQVLGSRLE
jgi:hypothetical protein